MVPKYEFVTFHTYSLSFLVKEKMNKVLYIILISFFSLTVNSCSSSSDNDSFTESTTTDNDNSTSTDNTTTDTTAPIIAEVTSVTTPTNDTTPDYTFSSDETGTITYGGSCSSSSTSATTGNNTITLASLTERTYSNCTITVTDNSSNSVTLNISSFVVDTTAPTVSSIYPTDNQSGISITTDNISVTFSEAMDNTSVTTNTDNTTCYGSFALSSDNFSSCLQMSSSPSISNSVKTFTVDTSDNLSLSTTYKTRVTTGVKDTAGNTLGSQYETSTGFTTVPPPEWAQEAYIKAANNDASDSFGDSVSLDNDTLAVGVQAEDSNQTTITNGTSASSNDSRSASGAVYVYKRNTDNSSWAQEAYIKAANLYYGDNFGFSVSLDSDTLAVGAINEDSNQKTITNGTSTSSNDSLSDSGAVYVYKRTGTSWAQEAYIKAVNSDNGDQFGSSVALDNNTLAVGAVSEDSNQTTITNGTGAPSNNNSTNSGAVYVYSYK
jgi:hypothetical protein